MRALRLLMLTAAAAALASCGGSKEEKKAPEGQVVAEVGGEEVTMRELNMELRNAAITDPQMLKAAERAAIAAIINRKVLAQAARERGIDDSADFQLARQRAEEVLLAQELQRQVAAKVARPTREEAEAFMAAHPNNFAQRKIYVVDQIQFPVGGNAEKLKAFAPLKTLDEVERKLLSEGMEYRRVPASIDARTVPPEIIDQIAKLPPGEVFLVPNGQTVLANQIRDARLEPFTGEPAITQAQQMLYNERLAKALAQQADQLKTKAGQINYKEGYGPPATGKPGDAAPASNQQAPAQS